MSEEDDYNRILSQMKVSAHGSRDLRELSDFLTSLKKRQRGLLEQKLMQEPIPWVVNRERETHGLRKMRRGRISIGFFRVT
jgi:hypothetical protein